MGLLDNEIIKFLNIAKQYGIKDKTLVMIGKQNFFVEIESFKRVLCEMGFSDKVDMNIIDKKSIDSIDFFKMIGFKEVHALDYSEYEGADIIWDLNMEIPLEMHQKFDYVIQGGTIEHVFDIAMAMKNVSNMVKVGGIIYHGAPSDGWINHGFYSISPIFFMDYYKVNSYRILSIELEMRYFDKDLKKERCIWSDDLRLFSQNSILNEALPEGKYKQIQVICIAQRLKAHEVKVPIQGMYDELYEGLKKTEKKVNINQEKIVHYLKNTNKKIALFGCGYICDILLDELYKYDLEGYVDVIFDSNTRRAGEIHRGYKVVYPTEMKLRKQCDFLITSIDYEDEIERLLINKGVDMSRIKKISEI